MQFNKNSAFPKKELCPHSGAGIMEETLEEGFQ